MEKFQFLLLMLIIDSIGTTDSQGQCLLVTLCMGKNLHVISIKYTHDL